MKKTFDWFKANQIAYTFFDFKQQSISLETFEKLFKQIPLTELVNNRGTTFKKLSAQHQAEMYNLAKAPVLLNQNLSVIKRPLIQFNQQFVSGFKPELWQQMLKQ